MKRFIAGLTTLILILLLLSGCVVETYYPDPTENFFVNDFADVLSKEDEQLIQSIGEALYKKTTAQVVVVTVENLNDEPIENYALNLFREWGIGDKEKNNGVLLLVSIEDRKSRVEVGYGLEGALPDGKTGRIQDEYMIPWFKEDNYAEGIKGGYSVIVKEVYKEYGIEDYTSDYMPTKPDSYEEGEHQEDESGAWFGLVIFIIFFADWIFFKGSLTRLIFLSSLFNNRRGGRGGRGGFGGGFGGGGFGGGGFSGGGGSTGGGGSSRGW